MFDFTEYIQLKKEEYGIDLGLFLELVEEDKIVVNQTAVNTLIEDMEKLEHGFFTIGVVFLGEERKLNLIDFFEMEVFQQNS